MKKNILIIGFGDLAERLEQLVSEEDINIYGLTRSPENHIGARLTKWDWHSEVAFTAPEKAFDTVIFFPKPKEYNEYGYRAGFIESLKIIHKSLQSIKFNSFIGISSTRVYGNHQDGNLNELNTPQPSDYRGEIILEYEKLIKSLFPNSSLVLRLSGLFGNKTNLLKDFVKNFDGVRKEVPNKFINRLSRDECAEIIAFAISHNLYSDHDLLNCSSSAISYEEYFEAETGLKDFDKYFKYKNQNSRIISSKKLQDLGFKF
jgi:hypothetical protein